MKAPHRVDPGGSAVAALEGQADVEEHEVTLRLVLDRDFSLRLPQWFLQPSNALGTIPHVDENGLICVADPEGLVLDRHRPVAVIREALMKAMGVLEDGVSGRNHADFVDELESYWRRLPKATSVTSVMEPTSNVHDLQMVVSHEGEVPLVGATHDDVVAFNNGAALGGKVTLRGGLYLPLEPGSTVVPPALDGPMWTAAEAREVILPTVSPENLATLQKLIKGRPRKTEYVIIGVPRPSGGHAIVGIKFEDVGRRHPLLDGGSAERVTPLTITRCELSYLVPRGGGDLDLAEERVLLVGGGAIGGHIAIELARAGVLDLTVVDADKLTADNSFRHVLGRQYWGRPKTEALKDEIEGKLPYVRVSSIVDTIERAMNAGAVDLGRYDLVVLALGNPTVELEVNERLHGLSGGPPGLFVWLEPLGIGGHALLTAQGGSVGCYECLYTAHGNTNELPPKSDEVLVNRAAFAAPGQAFGRALSGCGSLHSPFGSVDAVRTAAMATRLAIDALTSKETARPLLSWKGEDSAFVADGFRLSERHAATQDQLDRHRYKYASPNCAVCGSGVDGR